MPQPGMTCQEAPRTTTLSRRPQREVSGGENRGERGADFSLVREGKIEWKKPASRISYAIETAAQQKRVFRPSYSVYS